MHSTSIEVHIGEFMKLIDMKGKVFGMLTVIEKCERRKYLNGECIWKCQCQCKNIINVSGSVLRRGAKKNCGCISKITPKEYWEMVRNRLEMRCIRNGECKEWGGKRNKDGYGEMCIIENRKEKTIKCSRASWIIYRGEIPEGMCVLHKCDNPACFNIDHLFLGTMQDNMTDKMKKNRHFVHRGSACKSSKLNEEKAKNIFSLKNKIPAHKIAKHYNVSISCIQRIMQKITWKHIHEN